MNHPARVRLHAARQTGFAGEWLQPLRGDWPSAACRVLELEMAVVRVALASVKGSAPREAGACMLISANEVLGTIGGGNLEMQAIEGARELLARPPAGPAAFTRKLVLGTQLGQCCGGVVELWMERLTHGDLPLLRSAAQAARAGEPVLMTTALDEEKVVRRVLRAGTPGFLPIEMRAVAEELLAGTSAERVHLAYVVNRHASPSAELFLERIDSPLAQLWLYGAGHVGQALVRVLAELPIAVTWIDSRAELFPASLADNVQVLRAQDVARAAVAAPSSARHLVMTHDHALDYQVCRSILLRGEFEWLGLIGSTSKGARFRSRLRKDGVPDEALGRLVCPIGVEGVEGKEPAVIAVTVAAQILQTLAVGEASRCQDAATGGVSEGLSRDLSDPATRRAVNGASDCAGVNCASCGPSRRAGA
jgi:xanthine dehydrogenase accessory factor